MEKIISEKALAVDQGMIRIMFDKAAGMEDIISLGIGEPDRDTPAEICNACAEAVKSGYTHYAPNAGRFELRQAIAEKGLIAAGLYSPENEIIVTNGGMGAMALVMQILLEPGDRIIIQDPQYLNFATTISYCGGVPVRVPTTAEDSFCMRAENIRKAYVKGKTKAIIINSPNNPTGEVIPRHRLEEIANVAKELNLLVISDEVYGDLLYDDAERISIASLPDMKERTVVIGSFSKAFAMTGWRIGYAAGPASIIGRMTVVQEYFNSCINTAAQIGATYALYHRELALPLKESFSLRREMTISALSHISGMCFNRSKGAFYMFPDIRKFGMDSFTFCDRLLEEERLVCIPGSAFGACGEGYIRLSYTAREDKLEEGLARLKRFCEKY